MNANQNNNQNNNLDEVNAIIQLTTIRRLNDNFETTLILPVNRNSRYFSRTFILHDDGQTYDYVHEYTDKRPSTHNGKVSRRIWNKLNRLLENALEIQHEINPDEDEINPDDFLVDPPEIATDRIILEDELHSAIIGTLWNLLRNPEELDPEIFDNAVDRIDIDVRNNLTN